MGNADALALESGMSNYLTPQSKFTFEAKHWAMYTIAQTQFPGLERKPEIAVAIGGGHIGIERSFSKEQKERITLIRKLLQFPGLGDERKKIAAIARIDYENDENMRVKIFRDTDLAPLEGESGKQEYREEEKVFLNPKS